MSGEIVVERRGEVAVVTLANPKKRNALDPPMLLVCLNQRLPTRDAVVEARHFAVNVLAEHQAELALQFAHERLGAV